MRKSGALLCLVGGLLWAAKPTYDWLALGRRINTGYPASDPTDYLEFMIPLLCLGGLFALLSSYGKKLVVPSVILALGLIFTSGFHFFERYYPQIPAGLLFLIPGLLFLCIGSCLLFLTLKRMNEPFRSPLLISGSMVVVHILFCLFPFVSKSFENGLATGITVCLMVLVGLLWAWVGVFLWGRIKPVPFDKTML